jgi:DNA (cytosine-5)-methyltransferase 1
MRREPSPNGNTRKQNQEDSSPFGYYDFFAGGGMAGIGLGPRWKCLMANDFSEK